MRESGITPIVATILLIGMTVAAVSAVGIVVGSLAPGTAAPLVDFGDIAAEDVGETTKITFVHQGGEPVRLSEIKVTISGRDNNVPPQERSDTLRSSSTEMLELGDTVELGTPATQGYYYPQGNEVRIAVVHEPSGTVLADTRIPVSEPADGTKYGFETGVMGWEHQTYTDSQAITAVAHGGKVKLGYGSLQCTVDMVWNHPNKSKGEAWVDMRYNPPSGMTPADIPVNLEGVTVSAWVYCPPEASGPASSPNGLQLFFKDDSGWTGQYGPDPWVHVPQEGGWVKVTHTVTSGGSFDATRVLSVGAKIGTPELPWGSSNNDFSGYIYVDGFDW